MIIGLFACSPPPSDSTALLKSYKNNPFQAWKWLTVLFEITFTLEIIITLTYWIILHKESHQLSLDWKVQTNLWMDNTIPLIALLAEFLISNQPIVQRHFFLQLMVMASYVFVNIAYTLAGYPPYKENEWHTVGGFFTCIGMFAFGILVFFIMARINLYKLRGQSIVPILTKKEFDQAEGYKFSQFSHGDGSMGAKQAQLLGDNSDKLNPNNFVSRPSQKTVMLDDQSKQDDASVTMKGMPAYGALDAPGSLDSRKL